MRRNQEDVKEDGRVVAADSLIARNTDSPGGMQEGASITRDSYIRHYSPAWYDTAALKEHRARSRRDTSTSSRPKDSTLNLRLRALDRRKRDDAHPTKFHDIKAEFFFSYDFSNGILVSTLNLSPKTENEEINIYST
ncbi:hypothetical protein M0804_003059 [Polistes exclamans]|nr:hypothetical protein M0804_003059 [Polistes exclamans]